MHLIDRVDDGKSTDGPLNPEMIAIQFYVEVSPVVHDVEAQHASLSCKLGFKGIGSSYTADREGAQTGPSPWCPGKLLWSLPEMGLRAHLRLFFPILISVCTCHSFRESCFVSNTENDTTL